MENMYKGIAFSPQTTLKSGIGAADTTILVTDISAFPDAPSYATIGTDEEGETIFYAAKTATALSGCTRGVEGTAKAWQAGMTIARNFTAKDFHALQANVKENTNSLDAHEKDAVKHVTAAERTVWNGKEAGGAAAAVQENLDTHEADAVKHVTAAERTVWNAKSDKPLYRIVTLLATGWDAEAKTQTVTVSGVLADETAQLIQPCPAQASQDAYYSAGILCTGQAANSLTFTAQTAPTEDLTVYVAITEVSA